LHFLDIYLIINARHEPPNIIKITTIAINPVDSGETN